MMAGKIVRLCARDDLAPGTARRFDVDEHRIALVRIGDDYYAIADRCSHADFSLSEGDVWEDELELECPKHGSTFSLLTGEPQTLPATQPVPVYAVQVDGDAVAVYVEATGGTGSKVGTSADPARVTHESSGAPACRPPTGAARRRAR